jgi:hypothetical protein
LGDVCEILTTEQAKSITASQFDYSESGVKDRNQIASVILLAKLWCAFNTIVVSGV